MAYFATLEDDVSAQPGYQGTKEAGLTTVVNGFLVAVIGT